MHVYLAGGGKNAVFNGYRPVCRQYAGEWSEIDGRIMKIARFKGGPAIVVRAYGWHIKGAGEVFIYWAALSGLRVKWQKRPAGDEFVFKGQKGC